MKGPPAGGPFRLCAVIARAFTCSEKSTRGIDRYAPAVMIGGFIL